MVGGAWRRAWRPRRLVASGLGPAVRSALRATGLAAAILLGGQLIEGLISICVALWPLHHVFGVPPLPSFWPAIGSEKIIAIRASIGYPIIFVALALLSLWARRRTGWGIGVVLLLIYGVDLLWQGIRFATDWDSFRYPIHYIALATSVLLPLFGALLLRYVSLGSSVYRQSPVAPPTRIALGAQGISEVRLLRRLLITIVGATVVVVLLEAFIMVVATTPTVVG